MTQKWWLFDTTDGGVVYTWYDRSAKVWYAARYDAKGEQVGDKLTGGFRRMMIHLSISKWGKDNAKGYNNMV